MITMGNFFSRNVGQWDQGLRALAGALITWLAWFEGNDRWVIIGVIILFTSVLRFCPSYALFRFNTLKSAKSRESFSWEEFLDKNAPRAVEPKIVEPPLEPKVKPVQAKPLSTFTLPADLSLQLIDDLNNNALDEMLVLRFYENFFDCRISIVQQHIHNYRCDFQHSSQTYGFAELKAQLLERLQEQTAVNA
jgi:hypothetical protein